MTFYEQIQRSLDYTEKHLMEELIAENAASEACMSIANFYRYFTALTGFSWKEYVRKRRLSVLLSSIKSGEKKIIDVALLAGFESPDAFSRAFKREYGINPGEYRKKKTLLKGLQPKKIVEEYFMGIIIKELPTRKVAYYRVISHCPEEDAWSHLKKWGDRSGIFNKPYRIFGFNNPSPEEMALIKNKKGEEILVHADNSEYGYEFQITVDDSVSPEERGVGIKEVPGGKFAVMSIGVGCEDTDIGKGWAKFSHMLKEGGWVMTGRWYEEHLDFDENCDHFRMDLYVEIE